MAPRVPTGPVMVLVATAFFALSALLGPQRGLLSRLRRLRRNELRERRHHLLRAVIELREKDPSERGYGLGDVAAQLGWTPRRLRTEVGRLRRAGLAEIVDGRLRLTEAGTAEGTFIVKCHRLWEHYLVYRDILATDHVDRPADEVEHLLTPEIIRRLEELLAREHGLDPARVVNIHDSDSGYRPRGRETEGAVS